MDTGQIVTAIFNSALFLYMLTTLRYFSLCVSYKWAVKDLKNQYGTYHSRNIQMYISCKIGILREMLRIMDSDLDIIQLNPSRSELTEIGKRQLKRQIEFEEVTRNISQDYESHHTYWDSIKSASKDLPSKKGKIDEVRLESMLALAIFFSAYLLLITLDQIDGIALISLGLLYFVLLAFHWRSWDNMDESSDHLVNISQMLNESSKTGEKSSFVLEELRIEYKKYCDRFHKIMDSTHDTCQ